MDSTALEEYAQHSDALQFYLRLVLDTFTLALGATSGVAAYLAKAEGDFKSRAIVLLLPGVLCLGLGLGFWNQISAAEELRDQLIALTATLHFGLAPHGQILVNSVRWLGALLVSTGTSLVLFGLIARLKSPKTTLQKKRLPTFARLKH